MGELQTLRNQPSKSEEKWEEKYKQLEIRFQNYRLSERESHNVTRKLLDDAKHQLVVVKQEKVNLVSKNKFLRNQVKELQQKVKKKNNHSKMNGNDGELRKVELNR